MTFPGLQHVAITVSDLERSTAWYSALFGTEPVLDEDEEGGRFHHAVYALGGGALFGLHTHQGRESRDRFSEERTGLDHIAFGVGSHDELERWAQKLTELGIEHDGIKKAHYGSGVSFRDPDNIALEFFAAPES
ncbi:VOC family protein [Prauserella rugosa]|uniref:Catechol 2,3-dioxygenase-like lactoylglutathione lyase family enzyme n=1 Tax=Prauserella rugosa TaxID=43354 RepID=A0A660CAN6_9PSEU|nr:VOC family protein [Prauserella rugosa]KID27891.1 lactoylglutathione lyase-like lyase [Prauserella sp. Am3]KMS83060.1 glyoxalase [Streptomyces regensis]TWH20532.1 catechol 2,3-dioxygenase-like lactoylglutathione lyase family enzyme [Prauserella rugosa]